MNFWLFLGILWNFAMAIVLTVIIPPVGIGWLIILTAAVLSPNKVDISRL